MAQEEEEQVNYLLPSSQFSIHLLRRTTSEPLTNSETPRIEVEAKLVELNVELSRSALSFSQQLVDYFSRPPEAPRRPKK